MGSANIRIGLVSTLDTQSCTTNSDLTFSRIVSGSFFSKEDSPTVCLRAGRKVSGSQVLVTKVLSNVEVLITKVFSNVEETYLVESRAAAN